MPCFDRTAFASHIDSNPSNLRTCSRDNTACPYAAAASASKAARAGSASLRFNSAEISSGISKTIFITANYHPPTASAIPVFRRKERVSRIAPVLCLFNTDSDQVTLEAGNSASIIFKHYRELTTPEVAEKWFSILPKEGQWENTFSYSVTKRLGSINGVAFKLPPV